jgi:hypothetical protein
VLADQLKEIQVLTIPILCHTAVWFWAAQEAGTKNDPKEVILRISDLPAQPKMLALIQFGPWDFDSHLTTPAPGTVLVWEEGPTHSAVVTKQGAIAGYNQGCIFPESVGHIGFSIIRWEGLGKAHRRCQVVLETRIVQAARDYEL